ncbi:neurocalcin-delta B-like [Ixodes scapularis]|uniref:neurocalcin-delta B-like n=1 Tax=Ixodes scapularis TaxID=6945 RepID=UPI001A9D06C5|nr:neurocalcin-delta B-like [Ixodes scapularis]
MGNKKSKLNTQVLRDLWASTEFQHVEIIQWYRDFMREFPDGRITMDLFKKTYAKFFTAGVDSDEFAESLFRTLDVNKDGFIDFREFMRGLNATSRGKPDQKLTWAFNVYDLDGDGFIDKDEMLQMITNVLKMSASSKSTPSKDNLDPKKLVEQIFAAMDTNGDGKITLQEFLEGIKKDPTCVNLLLSDIKPTS